MGARLPIAPDVLAALCRRRRIRKLSLFGSQLKGTARPDSDIAPPCFDSRERTSPTDSPPLSEHSERSERTWRPHGCAARGLPAEGNAETWGGPAFRQEFGGATPASASQQSRSAGPAARFRPAPDHNLPTHPGAPQRQARRPSWWVSP